MSRESETGPLASQIHLDSAGKTAVVQAQSPGRTGDDRGWSRLCGDHGQARISGLFRTGG